MKTRIEREGIASILEKDGWARVLVQAGQSCRSSLHMRKHGLEIKVEDVIIND